MRVNVGEKYLFVVRMRDDRVEGVRKSQERDNSLSLSSWAADFSAY